MNKKAVKALLFFLLLMLFFTFVSWKLDAIRMPQVLCVEPTPEMVGGKAYNMVVPSESIHSGEEPYVYLVEDSTSYFYPVVARQITVTVLASENGRSAIEGIRAHPRVVRFADRPLGGGAVPVSVWEGAPGEGRVEVIGAPDGAADVLQQAAEREERPWQISWEEDRLVLENADQFTAQMVRAVLAAGGMEAAVLDYTWGPALLAQTEYLWLVWAAAMGLWLLWSVLQLLGRREWDRAQEALEEQYLSTYLADAGVRLLAEGIVLAVSAILTVAALQWLWQVEIALPRDFLPQGSILAVEPYRMWVDSTFPAGWCSAYGADLAAELRRRGLATGAVCGVLTVCAIVLRKAAALRRRRSA